MKNDALNRTKLNSLSKDALILLLLQQSENFQLLSEQSSVIQKQNEQLIKQIERLKEHHIKVYAGDCDKDGILRAKAPNRLLSHSISRNICGYFIFRKDRLLPLSFCMNTWEAEMVPAWRNT
ncbi:hypothetical protein [Oribacterium asaccharolyticum]|uniref:hypothetical protein n=1 Tax=Oribacterium asaccharolyticum TaxID=1501332 RepID=UPI0028EE45C4|nr:hypothetical protein [Oribacterium asaccharolyticum]